MISDYLAHKLLDSFLNTAPYETPANVYMGLFKSPLLLQTATPANEISGGSYARPVAPFVPAVNALTYNSAQILFPNPTANWAPPATPVVSVAIMDTLAAGEGNWLVGDNSICARSVLSGDAPPHYEIGDFKIDWSGMRHYSYWLTDITLDGVFRAVPVTPAEGLFLALLKAVPSRVNPSTTFTEVTGTGYARQPIAFSAAANRMALNSALVSFPVAGADWATAASPVTCVALMDASGSGGHWVMAAPICPLVILQGSATTKFQKNSLRAHFDTGFEAC